MQTCNPNKIASLLTAASLAIIAAVALYSIASVLPSNWWTAGGAFAVMLITAGVIAVAVGFVNGAAFEAANARPDLASLTARKCSQHCGC